MDRKTIIESLRQNALNGGIHLVHGDLQEARRELASAGAMFNEAHSRFIKKAYPRHYRVLVYGSAHLHSGTPEYKFVRDLTHELVARTGCDIITGGGPGIMEAAPDGGQLARKLTRYDEKISRSRNFGINIKLPWEQKPNDSIDHYSIHEGFSTRLAEFMGSSHAAFVTYGGIGTALELIFTLQELQVKHIEENYPLIVHPFWKPVLTLMKQRMYDDRLRNGAVPLIKEGDFDGITFSDDIPTIVAHIERHHKKWEKDILAKVKKEERLSHVL